MMGAVGGSLSRLNASLLILFFAGIVVTPIGFIIVSSLMPGADAGAAGMSLGAWSEAWSQPGIREAIANTVRRVVITEAIALPAAIVITWLLARYDVPGKGLIDILMWIGFFLPSVPVILGWILLFDPQVGLINQLVRTLTGAKDPLFDIYSFWGIVFAHLATRAIAAKYIFLMPAFRNLNAALEEAAEMCGASRWRAFWTIALPALRPAIVITALISLIFSIESFEIELVLGPPADFFVFSTKVYQLIHEDPPQFQLASVLSIAVLLVMLPLFVLQRSAAAGGRAETIGSQFRNTAIRLRRWRWLVFGLLLGLVAVVTLVPFGAMLLGAFMKVFGFFNIDGVFTTAHWARVWSDPVFIRSLWNTFVMASGAAVLGTIAATAIAYFSVRSRHRMRALLDLASWLPAAVPGVILGLGILWMFLALPIFRPVYGTVIVLILATAFASLTVAVQLMKSNMVQLGRDMEEASALAGAHWLQTFRRIVVPILGSAFVTAAIIVFAASARNVSNVALLSTGDNRPLALLQVDYVADGLYESGSIVGIVLVLMSAGVAIAAKATAGRLGMRV